MVSEKEMLWSRGDGPGLYAVFTLHDVTDYMTALDRSDKEYVKLDPSQDIIDQVRLHGLSMDGRSAENGFCAASYARVATVSAKRGAVFPSEEEISVQYQLGTIQFGDVVPREEEYIDDTRGTPKANASLDGEWVCRTRCGVVQNVMKTDIAVATADVGSIKGRVIYSKGQVTPEWLDIIPKLDDLSPSDDSLRDDDMYMSPSSP